MKEYICMSIYIICKKIIIATFYHSIRYDFNNSYEPKYIIKPDISNFYQLKNLISFYAILERHLTIKTKLFRHSFRVFVVAQFLFGPRPFDEGLRRPK